MNRAVALNQALLTTLCAKEVHLYFRIINFGFRKFENEMGE